MFNKHNTMYLSFGQAISEMSSTAGAVPTVDTNNNADTPSTTSETKSKNVTEPPTAHNNMDNLAIGTTRKPLQTQFKTFNKKCPEKEAPANLGSYEIPTERDLVLFTMRTLHKMFNSYHEKTLYLLKDIYEVTKTTRNIEKQCVRKSRNIYKKCVQRVSKKCAAIVKDSVATVDQWQHSVADLTEGRVCNMAALKTDPLQLIKILALEEASLGFALPAFLRLIGECSAHCFEQSDVEHNIHPQLSQLTNHELVVRHFLMNKTNIQRNMDSDILL